MKSSSIKSFCQWTQMHDQVSMLHPIYRSYFNQQNIIREHGPWSPNPSCLIDAPSGNRNFLDPSRNVSSRRKRRKRSTREEICKYIFTVCTIYVCEFCGTIRLQTKMIFAYALIKQVIICQLNSRLINMRTQKLENETNQKSEPV
jgi:ribosomal protein L32